MYTPKEIYRKKLLHLEVERDCLIEEVIPLYRVEAVGQDVADCLQAYYTQSEQRTEAVRARGTGYSSRGSSAKGIFQ
ncbi:MAG: hypothetical protein GKR89_27610 [Candidatus Latescibacteria bacterium]|nr:hypothetical protein [Candidatus Latescibacterota bacterium]